MTDKLHQENSEELEKLSLAFPNTDKATLTETLDRNSTQKFKDLLDVLIKLHHTPGAFAFTALFQTLCVKSTYAENLFSEVRTFGELIWQSLAAKAVQSNFEESKRNEISAECGTKSVLYSRNPTTVLKNQGLKDEDNEINLSYVDCKVHCHPMNSNIGR